MLAVTNVSPCSTSMHNVVPLSKCLGPECNSVPLVLTITVLVACACPPRPLDCPVLLHFADHDEHARYRYLCFYTARLGGMTLALSLFSATDPMLNWMCGATASSAAKIGRPGIRPLS
ncbi:hypothetical protein OBBRIDRAFT_15751 [Obba rivulosa]|uniref:Uncharacterized protein n=1 Tax=Obba rivulosa TaxID=1052685 RepID=A0A8E2DVJ0_9APHY|nr:hypothetical protein OBBRIDRAFT_15751 [Obba rivulosa]